ncbi:hypothetical protein EV361DRAFT_866821 [Lentinula raphanica]|uniref:Uncharacterized protein n=1 Tax=Lentinula raphanica TaxID=153919 RepID=A0AA38PHQ0_9AGAR|nr:hypothetical protein F5880DRAFT_1606684 [Lentinula raphanica]KAJ3843129.1 hypothetical protein F5878DRAFT_638350 [Lentinula raphanica]KAJ3973545.1 hypothetical protein EV361DRAFT_866821 [Lentinula raphanica]
MTIFSLVWIWTSLVFAFAVNALPVRLEHGETRTNIRFRSTTNDTSSGSHVYDVPRVPLGVLANYTVNPSSPSPSFPPSSSILRRSPSSPPKTVPVQLWIHAKGTDSEHWSLVIDSTRGFAAEAPDPYHQDSQPLRPLTFSYYSDQKSQAKLMDLNCQATFENDEKMDEIFKDLVNNSKIGWGGKLPREIGGNCMDYVKGALEYLVKGKNIKQMPVKFTELWDREYKEVQKKVWGRQ